MEYHYLNRIVTDRMCLADAQKACSDMGTDECPASLIAVENIRNVYINAIDSVAVQDSGFIREYHVNAIYDAILPNSIGFL